MADAGTSITTPLLVKVTVAGTAVQLVQTSTGTSGTTAKTVIVQALSTNTEPVVIGDEHVKAKAGTQAAPEQRGIELTAKQTIAFDIIDPTTIWVDARTSKDGVAYLVLNA